MTIIFPKNNLPEAAQPWAREIQKQVVNVATSSVSDEVNNLARDNQLNGSLLTLTSLVNEVKAAAEAAQAAADEAQAAADDAFAAQGTANSAYSYADSAYTGLDGLDSSGSTFTVNADNVQLGAISASSLTLTSASYELRVGTTSSAAYLRCAPDAPNGVGVNEIGFAASATSGVSGWVSNCFPNADNSYSIGTSTRRWDTIYSNTGTINTSDMRLKKEIEASELGLDFIKSLNPVSYKWIIGSIETLRDENGDIVRDENGELINLEKPGVRRHWGFLAQEVKQSIDSSGVEDFAGFVQSDMSDPDSTLFLRYEEFISPMVKAIQELSAKVEALESK